jgi:hypothetical protein
MAKNVGMKDAQAVAGNKRPAPVFYCPVALATHVIGATGTFNDDPVNFLDIPASGQQGGKFLYAWLANPWSQASVASAGGDIDLAGAWFYWHVDVDPPVLDQTRKCQPGLEYLRKVGDKNASRVAICSDQTRQQQTAGGWFWMHGNGSTDPRRGWKNELFGDGHCEQLRADQVKKRWGGPTNPTAW